MRTRAALLLCLAHAVPVAARAQTAGAITVTETSATDSGGRNDGNVNIAECRGTISDTMSFTWPATGAASGSTLRLYAALNDTQCPPTATAKAVLESYTDGTTTTSTVFQVSTGIIGKLVATCGSGKLDDLDLCLTVQPSGGTEVSTGKVLTKTLDGTTPPPGVVTGATPGDGALNVAWDAGPSTTGATGISASYKAKATAPPGCTTSCTETHLSSEVTGSTSVRLTGLTNDVTYDIRVIAYTAAGNPSTTLSDPFPGTPRPVDDFWNHYTKDGGREQGGCGGPVGALALLALLPLGWRLRRRRP